MSKPLVLRCQYGGGQRKVLNNLTVSSKLSELRQAIFLLTDVAPHRQKVMSGFPPKEINICSQDDTIGDISIRSGDTLIIEENKSEPKEAPANEKSSKLVRKVVPADNSCLFASLSLVMLSDTSFANELRQLAATCIAQDPVAYNEAFLGKTNSEYCQWLSQPDHWGGAIELNVFAKHYQMEIDVADIQSGRIDRFGEDEHYDNRVFLLYDGIHYDALALEENDVITQTVFPTTDMNRQIEALAIAEDCKKQRQYTDLAGFSLRCLVCNTPLKGQTQAQQHAKETGHMNFGEV
ncbi:ubiquitin thioesterase OTU1-like [Hydractinia symbiolongicarpus]|uniref:ubiquitin thioesterase OTU1-like n=1 Tax=Hydractinia symbiolongicarpus TaxID=13093 RepID=UPI00254E9ED6|nr:ubiquitin thioesterase OTU1-like [Hydractinia symbiolongicarpus]